MSLRGSVFNTDEFLEFASRYRETVYRLSDDFNKYLISAARDVLKTISNATPVEIVDRVYSSLDGRISRRGIAESLFDEDYSYSGEDLRKAYNHFKNAAVISEANGIDFLVSSISPNLFRTTIDIYRYGELIDFIDICSSDEPDSTNLKGFFDSVSECIDNSGDEIPLSAYMALDDTMRTIDELEKEYVLK